MTQDSVRGRRVLLSLHGASLFGAERVMLDLARSLSELGARVVLDVPHDGPALSVAHGIPGISVVTTYRRCLPKTLSEAVRFVVIAPRDVLRVYRLIRATGSEMVVANTIYNPHAVLAARLAGVAVAWYAHERCPDGFPGRIAAWAFSRLSTLALVNSEYVRSSFERAGARWGRVETLHPPLRDDIASAQAPSTFTVGYLGRLDAQKRPQDVIRAARLVDAPLLMVGDGRGLGPAQDLARELGVDASFPGYQTDIAPWLSRMSCLVVPSEGEAWGMVAMEALAAGVPVVAANHGGLPELLGEAGVLYPLGDVPALAASLTALRHDPLTRSALSQKGMERAGPFRRDAWKYRAASVLSAVVAPD